VIPAKWEAIGRSISWSKATRVKTGVSIKKIIKAKKGWGMA
jgi:hypothetical protein